MTRTLKALRQFSAAACHSIAELIRTAIDYLVLHRRAPADDQAHRAIRVAGMFSSGNLDTSAHHDRYLAEAFQR